MAPGSSVQRSTYGVAQHNVSARVRIEAVGVGGEAGVVDLNVLGDNTGAERWVHRPCGRVVKPHLHTPHRCTCMYIHTRNHLVTPETTYNARICMHIHLIPPDRYITFTYTVHAHTLQSHTLHQCPAYPGESHIAAPRHFKRPRALALHRFVAKASGVPRPPSPCMLTSHRTVMASYRTFPHFSACESGSPIQDQITLST